ncbi:DEAD-box type RNA helicase [Mycoemilia scoparia]|uniref:DEAD-box type RNA helicase n=1 Tax=Mycoemilia scoparia TaxID=417184 RepID=A0A9W8DPT4_9FUNG|nr:DEAD-box type RNA helicase [Mycoemilia scoparia]
MAENNTGASRDSEVPTLEEVLKALQEVERKKESAGALDEFLQKGLKYFLDTEQEFIKERYLEQYEAPTVEDFFGVVEEWDVARIIDTIAKTTKSDLTICSHMVFEALRSPTLTMKYPNLLKAVTNALTTTFANGQLIGNDSHILPGSVSLAFHKDSVVRRCGRAIIKRAGSEISVSDFNNGIRSHLVSALANVFGDATTKVKETEPLAKMEYPYSSEQFWRGFKTILKRMSREVLHLLNTLTPDLPSMLCRCIVDGNDDGSYLELLSSFSVILSFYGSTDFWGSVAKKLQMVPSDIAISIFHNPNVQAQFRRKAAVAPVTSESGAQNQTEVPDPLSEPVMGATKKHLSTVIDWISPFVGSFSFPQDRPAIAAILRPLIYELTSDTDVPLSSKAVCYTTSIRLIQFCYNQIDINDNTSVFEMYIPFEFINEHIGRIVQISNIDSPYINYKKLLDGTEKLIENMLTSEICNAWKLYLRISTIKTNESSLIQKTPVLMPGLWESLLEDPRDTNIVAHTLSAVSYLFSWHGVLIARQDFANGNFVLSNGLPEQVKKIEGLLVGYLKTIENTLVNRDEKTGAEFEKIVLTQAIRLSTSCMEAARDTSIKLLSRMSSVSTSDMIVDEADPYLQMTLQTLLRHKQLFIETLNVVLDEWIGFVKEGMALVMESSLIARILQHTFVHIKGSRLYPLSDQNVSKLCLTAYSWMSKAMVVLVERSGNMDPSQVNLCITSVILAIISIIGSIPLSIIKENPSIDAKSLNKAAGSVQQMLSLLGHFVLRNPDDRSLQLLLALYQKVIESTDKELNLDAKALVMTLTSLKRLSGAIITQPIFDNLDRVYKLIVSKFPDADIQTSGPAVSGGNGMDNGSVYISDDEMLLDSINDDDILDVLDSLSDIDVPISHNSVKDQLGAQKPRKASSDQEVKTPVPQIPDKGQTDYQKAEKPPATQDVKEIQLTHSYSKPHFQKTITGWLGKDTGRPSLTESLKDKSRKLNPKLNPSRRAKDAGSSTLLKELRRDIVGERPPPSSSSFNRPPTSTFATLQRKPQQQVSKVARSLALGESAGGQNLKASAKVQSPKISKTRGKLASNSDSESSDEEDNSDSDREASGALRMLADGSSSPPRPINETQLRTKMFDLPGMSLQPFGRKFGASAGNGGGSLVKPTDDHQQKQFVPPNLDILHQIILKWSYEYVGDTPTYFDKTKYMTVPKVFESFEHYEKVFEPLLVLETWTKFQTSKQECINNQTFNATQSGRISVDKFIDITLTMTRGDAETISENDLIVMAYLGTNEKVIKDAQNIAEKFRDNQSKCIPEADLQKKALERFSNRITVLGKVQNKKFAKDMVDVVVRLSPNPKKLKVVNNKLVDGSVWDCLKLFCLTPVHREYIALKSLRFLPKHLSDDILFAKIRNIPMLNEAKVRACMKAHGVNQPQAESILTATHRGEGFTLVQGPPGTGKTKTILGLIGSLLSGQLNYKPDYKKSKGQSSSLMSEDERKHWSHFSTDSNNKNPKHRILVCAPSNAAVDEIVKRLMQGIRDGTGKTFYPRVVRVGLSESINSAVKDMSLDSLVDKELNTFSELSSSKQEGTGGGLSNYKESSDTAKSLASAVLSIKQKKIQNEKLLTELFEQKASIIIKRNDIRLKLHNSDNAPSLDEQRELEAMSKQYGKKIREIEARIDSAKTDSGRTTQEMDMVQRNARLNILRRTDVLCCTLSGSGHDIMNSMPCDFETVIIDEAAQSVELASLIPLRNGCKRCVLVGDPNQLPPTVLSTTATEYNYEQSLFVRIQNRSPSLVNLLSIQYRMHPDISQFPSRLFYDSRLKDGPGLDVKQTDVWHKSNLFRPFMFFNVHAGKETNGRGGSYLNNAEVMAAVSLVERLCKDFENIPFASRIGIITPYKQQLKELKSRFAIRFGKRIFDAIDFNTVDGFQGQEKDIIIFSCVRAGGRGIGFLSDTRRMNVGLTRARKSLFVLGNSRYLQEHALWSQLIEDSKFRRVHMDIVKPYFGINIKTAGPGTMKNLFEYPKEETNVELLPDGEGNKKDFVMNQIVNSTKTSVPEKPKEINKPSAQPEGALVPKAANSDSTSGHRSAQPQPQPSKDAEKRDSRKRSVDGSIEKEKNKRSPSVHDRSSSRESRSYEHRHRDSNSSNGSGSSSNSNKRPRVDFSLDDVDAFKRNIDRSKDRRDSLDRKERDRENYKSHRHRSHISSEEDYNSHHSPHRPGHKKDDHDDKYEKTKEYDSYRPQPKTSRSGDEGRSGKRRDTGESEKHSRSSSSKHHSSSHSSLFISRRKTKSSVGSGRYANSTTVRSSSRSDGGRRSESHLSNFKKEIKVPKKLEDLKNNGKKSGFEEGEVNDMDLSDDSASNSDDGEDGSKRPVDTKEQMSLFDSIF